MENNNLENSKLEIAGEKDIDIEETDVENSAEPITASERWEKFKNGSIEFLDRRRHSKKENIRLAAAVAMIVFIIGVFLPLIGGTMKFSMANSSGTRANSETVIFQPENDIVKFSAGDLVFHKPLKEFELFGTELGDMSILGLNLYDTLTTTMPDYSGIKKAKEGLQSGALSFLTDDKFVKFCNEKLGDFGKTVVEIGEVVNEVADSAGEALAKVVAALDKVKTVSDKIRTTIQNAENNLSTIETLVAIVFAAVVALMLLVIFRRNRNYVIPWIMSFFSAVFVAIGVATIVINSEIKGAIASGMDNLSGTISDTLDGLLPGSSDMLTTLMSSVGTVNFLFEGKFYCGAGWWLLTIGIVAITVLSFVLVKMERKTVMQSPIEVQ